MASKAEMIKAGLEAFLTIADAAQGFSISVGNETWHFGPESAPTELAHLATRTQDIYPQGRAQCIKFLEYCRDHRVNFVVVANKTLPHWTWAYAAE